MLPIVRQCSYPVLGAGQKPTALWETNRNDISPESMKFALKSLYRNGTALTMEELGFCRVSESPLKYRKAPAATHGGLS